VAVIFLDPDDEITTAIARLRASQDIKVALVLPPGSRLGTSRINFRLLAREAHDLPRQASIVTAEAGVRAIAVSAGLPAYASVGEYEAAVGTIGSAGRGEAPTPGSTPGAVPGAGAAAAVTEPSSAELLVESAPTEPPAATEAPDQAGAHGLVEAAAIAAAAAASGAAGASAAAPEAGSEPTPGATPSAELPPATPSRRKRGSKVPSQPTAGDVAAAAAVGAAVGPEAAADVPVVGQTADRPVAGPAAALPVSGPAADAPAIGAEGPTTVMETAVLAGGEDVAMAADEAQAAAAHAADEAQAAAASAFGAEVAGVPPPPRGPGPRSSAALPVVGGPVRSRGALGGHGALVGVLVVIAVVGALALALAVIVLPQATITVAAPLETVGPVSRTVTADPTAIEADPGTGVIPAQQVSIPLSARGEFTATGVKVTETKAKGSVTFTNYDTSSANTISSGSVVATPDGVQFKTLQTVVVPAAKVKGPTKIDPGQASVRIEAAKVGTAGNVAPGTITRVPPGENGTLLDVRNPAATTGGDRNESPRVSQEDVDVAVADLTKDLETQMAAALADPATAPAGTTLIEETAAMGKVKATPALTNLVGKTVQTFDLALTATGQVIAVDTGVLEPLAASALAAAVPEGAVLFPESVRTTVGKPTVDGGVVSFEIGATGEAWRPLDEAALLATVRGRSVLEAEDALARYGKVTVDVWPFYVATIPEGDRATLTVVAPTPSAP
jgi:hypothetical protein